MVALQAACWIMAEIYEKRWDASALDEAILVTARLAAHSIQGRLG